jgi:hypothetical protein
MYELSLLVSFVFGMLFFFSLVLPIDKKRKHPKVYGFIFFLSSIVSMYLMPTDFSEGKKLFEEREWQQSIDRLSKVNQSSFKYPEAKKMLIIANINKINATFEIAKSAYYSKEWSNVIALLSDFPKTHDKSAEALRMIEEAKKAHEIERVEAQKAEILARLPNCDSVDAEVEVMNALRNAPLGRVYGLEILKIKNAQVVSEREGVRLCRGVAFMNNGNNYVVSYSFYFDDDGAPMVRANVMGL